MDTAASIASRFWPKVERRGATDCWEWSAYRDLDGYGRMGVVEFGGPKGNRIAWSLCNGPIPGGMSVLHRCDNPPCVNPRHLFLGTQVDNMRDAYLKGRLKKTRSPTCGKGHTFTPENTGTKKNGSRWCKMCEADYFQKVVKPKRHLPDFEEMGRP